MSIDWLAKNKPKLKTQRASFALNQEINAAPMIKIGLSHIKYVKGHVLT